MRYFHSTETELQPGTIVQPASAGFDNTWSVGMPGYDPTKVYVFDQRQLTHPEFDPIYPNSLRYTYEVEPLGPLDQDREGEALRKLYEARHGHPFTTLYHPTDVYLPVVPDCPECEYEAENGAEGPDWYHPYNWRTTQARVLGPLTDDNYPDNPHRQEGRRAS